MKAVFITYNQAITPRVMAILDDQEVRGFTLFPLTHGRGSFSGEPHMGSHAWPSMNSSVLAMVEDGKVYALTESEKYRLKQRLYLLEEMLDVSFVKINKSCIANIRKIKKFDASFSGTLTVVFKNGYRDYVSRRNLKSVKERLGV